MLQCLDAESRCIYILGTMFRLDSRIAADILDLTPEAYRQRLSRIRRKMGAFLGEFCGLSKTGMCACARRVNYAAATHRLNPANREFENLDACSYKDITEYVDAMEELDSLSQVFADFPAYHSPKEVSEWIRGLIESKEFTKIMKKQGDVS